MIAGLTHRLLFSVAGISHLRRSISAHFSSSSTMSSSDDTPSIQTVYVNPGHFPPSKQQLGGSATLPLLYAADRSLRSPSGLPPPPLPPTIRYPEHCSRTAMPTIEAAVVNSRMVNTGKMPEDIVPTAVIHAYFRAGKTEEALNAFLKMASAGIKPNPYTYALLIKGLARCGMVEEAAKYMLEMVEDWLNPNAAPL